MESLNNAIGVYKTTLAVCSELADEDYSPALDKATLSFLEELKEYRGYGTVEEFKHYRLGDCMNDCEHYDNCADYIYSKGYNKAIDDFENHIKVEILPMFQTEDEYNIAMRSVDDMAEELKSQTKL
jgi:hypothetical protein